MNIFIYGDSNTWGYVPNVEGYSKMAVQKRYNIQDIWWYPLTLEHKITVNGLCGRAISNDNPWLEGRNARKTIRSDLKDVRADLVIVQLGTNDCKSRYNLSADKITSQLSHLCQTIMAETGSKIMIISPPIIKSGTPITDKYYVGAEEKSKKLTKHYCQLAENKGYSFVSGMNLEIGEDGEHLTTKGHKELGKKVMKELSKFLSSNIKT